MRKHGKRESCMDRISYKYIAGGCAKKRILDTSPLSAVVASMLPWQAAAAMQSERMVFLIMT